MTDKEKAKAYDEAIERVKKLYGNGITEEIFPEIKEYNNERIRKNCIHFLECQKQHDAATFAIEECIDWLERQDEQASAKINERAWLYLVSDVLTWQDGIGQYLDDPRVQEFAKRLCKEYEQKLYNPSNTVKNEQRSADKIEPKFKVGDRVRHKETNKDDVYEISKVYDDSYGIAGFTWMIYMKYQDEYELVTNKFDPNTLKPFDKVLVRDYCNMEWSCDIFSHIKQEGNLPYVCAGSEWKCCIPYNDDTKHLVGTTEEAPEYYRYWED